jgi:hypothetical protein
MRRLAAALALVVVMSSPAAAYLVEVTTSIAVTGTEDRGELQNALMTAVDDVLKEAIAFTPTLIVLTHATRVGDRLYVRLLVADSDGERTFDELQGPAPTPAETELRI